jgi:sulfite reductase (NADPH) hemoprotein beta-component
VPYGTLSSRQVRKLAHIARTYDKNFGHFTTRTNMQFHWIRLVDVPAIQRELASVEMHCIQTSGNCVRNTTADQFAGATPEEIEDPRPLCEIIRQWSSLHPEFVFLARKFKIAVGACEKDRAALQWHDMAVQVVRNAQGRIGYLVMAGGGMGRTPYVAHVMNEFVEREDILAYLEAVLRVYNQDSRRDNIHKQRIKILINTIGPEEMRRRVDIEFQELKRMGTLQLPREELARIAAYFAPPDFETGLADTIPSTLEEGAGPDFANWVKTNVAAHKAPGYAIATITLKTPGQVPGDITSQQMDAVANIMDEFSLGEVRVTHEQNLVLPHVRKKDLPAIYARLKALDFAAPNAGLITDIIACPGLDYCDLANARAIPIAQKIARKFENLDRQHEIGEMKIKISGCINACGHHHAGHIGILGVDKKGVEFYQLLLGGSGAEDASVGTIMGPGFTEHEIADAVERVVDLYLKLRHPGERFLDTYRRVGMAPFKDAAYEKEAA